MMFKKVMLAGLAGIALCFAQNVSISGKVTDVDNAPIAGAVVKLEHGGQTATTGDDGTFTLSGISAIERQQPQFRPHMFFATINRGSISITVREKSDISIIGYTMQGQAVWTVRKIMVPGTHYMPLLTQGAGVYLYRISSGTDETVLKSISMSGMASGTMRSIQAYESNAVAKVSLKTDVVDDVIRVIKDGYLNYRVLVTNSDTSGIAIRMIASAGTVTDEDGNVYQTVKIGNQVWTAENLRTTKYNDGSDIPHVPLISNWTNLTTPAYVAYGNMTDADSVKLFGLLYNFYTVDTKKLAPAGWHVPTSDEWDTLQNFLISEGYNWDGTTTDNKIGKALATQTDWTESGVDGTVGGDIRTNNSTGFAALPGGSRYYDVNFNYLGQIGYWWTSTKVDDAHADYRMLNTFLENLDSYLSLSSCGLSIRLVKD